MMSGACSNIWEADNLTKKSGNKMKLSVRESGRKRSLNVEPVMAEDLKVFADSLIHELAVARESMFADMRKEMKNLMDSRLNLKLSKKSKTHPQNGTEVHMKLQNCSVGSMDSNVASETCNLSKAIAEDVRYDQLPELKTTNEHGNNRTGLSTIACAMLAHSYNQAVSMPHLALPSVLPKPRSQRHRNSIPLDDLIPAEDPMNSLGLDREDATLMNAENFHHQDALFHFQEQYGSMPDLMGQNCAQTVSMGVGFPTPLIQMDNDARLSCSSDSFLYNTRVGLKFNGANRAVSDCVFPNSIGSNMPCKTDGEFVCFRPQDLKNGI